MPSAPKPPAADEVPAGVYRRDQQDGPGAQPYDPEDLYRTILLEAVSRRPGVGPVPLIARTPLPSPPPAWATDDSTSRDALRRGGAHGGGEGVQASRILDAGSALGAAGDIDGEVNVKDNRVFLRKRCAEHGQFEALLYSDAEMYFDSLRFNKPGTIPLETQTEVKDGCPLDCGLCPEHKQHACLGIIEVNTNCNLDCPICFADSGHQPDGFSLTMDQVEAGLDLASLLEPVGGQSGGPGSDVALFRFFANGRAVVAFCAALLEEFGRFPTDPSSVSPGEAG